MKFIFERNLPHQKNAVMSIIDIFKNLEIITNQSYINNFINPKINLSSELFLKNIKKVMKTNYIELTPKKTNIIDILMETGTGKTYTYTKTIFELNKYYGINKFIIIVPSLAIKAGVKSFINNDSARIHFKNEYQKTINLYVLESTKNKKNSLPISIKSFVEAVKNNNTIEVLLINQGMLNSETLINENEKKFLDIYKTPFEALSAINPVVIIDEPHRFKQNNKTWKKIQKLNPQFILRFGATFEEDKRGKRKFENLIYSLSAAEAFNNNLVKGVIGYIEKNESGKNALIELINLDGKEATFIVKEYKNKKTYKLKMKDNLGKVHSAIDNLYIEKMNKSELLLSNGLILRKKDKLNPYSFSETLEETMIKKTIENHFKIEKELIENRSLLGKPKIKPLTLFFIDNIDEYRNENGKLKQVVEDTIKFYIEKNLKETKDEYYKNYLVNSLKNISKTHGGYFSKDNQVKDEEIEEEINEILHDKDKLLDLDNPRRFIFSKWTLKEGWDNPNVFQICKLRSSGSEISKLQEVGRGLRLPVNEYGIRVKEEFYLHYFVDFTEEDFVDRLVNEINEKSNLFNNFNNLEELTDELIENIVRQYKINEDELFAKLIEEKIINRKGKFINNGLEKLRNKYPLGFIKDKVSKNKVKKAEKNGKTKIRARIGKYAELKELWEKINQKALMEIKIKNEKEFEKTLYDFFIHLKKSFITKNNIYFETKKLKINNNQAYFETHNTNHEIVKLKNMNYKNFVLELSQECKINVNTLHNVFLKLKENEILDITEYLNYSTLRTIKHKFDEYLLINSLDKFKIDYKIIKTSIHPTKLTDKNGLPIKSINSSDIGRYYANEKVSDSYYFNELFYDSDLEKKNIQYENISIEVFTKIPKNSIKIPIIGGKSYSPDFAYIIKDNKNNTKIYFIIETKDKEEKDLTYEEIIKIKLAEKFFKEKIKILFKTQLKNTHIEQIIKEFLN